MTRETKIGLLVGLAFIILFGIILSEKGTGRNEQFATPNPAPPLVELVPPTFTPPTAAEESSPEAIMDSKVTMNDPEVKVTEKIETPGPSHMIIKQGQASDTQQQTAQQEISPKFKEMLPPTPTRALSQIPASSMPAMVQPAPLAAKEVEMVAITEDQLQAPAQATQEAVQVAAKTQDHVVAQGETIASICRQYYPAQPYTMVSAVLKANNIANPQKLKVGQTLKLPNVTQQVAAAEQPKPETAKSALASSKLLTPVEDATIVGMINPNKTKVNVAVASNSDSKTYTVQEKDTLVKIAKQFYGSEKAWTKIYEMNKKVLKNPHSLKSGINLKLPAVELAAGPKRVD
jgi:nucleoid-associated protein YgaU